MIFLNPAILFGLLAASIPVMIHLLNLRRLKRIEFSTLAFLKEIQKSKIRHVKVKQWILLLLRILIVILLITAFARPTLKSASVGGAAPAAKSSNVIVLDNSFSMSVITENGSLFNHAKKIAGRILAESVTGDDFTLITTSNPAEGIKISNSDEFLRFLNDLSISEISGTIENALVKGAEELNKSGNLIKNIYLLSDFQKSRLKNTGENNFETSDILFDNINLFTFDFSADELINLSISNLEVNNQVFELNKQISFTATIINHSDVPVNNSVSSLFINGKREAQHSINLSPNGTTQVTFETILKEAGLVEILCSLEDDQILYDNIRYRGIFVPEKISLLLLADNPGDTNYLRLALSGNNTSSQFDVIQNRTDQVNSIDLNKYDVLIIVGTELIQNYSNIGMYLFSGGQIIIMPGENSTLSGYKKALGSLRLPLPSRLIGSGMNYNSYASFEEINFMHPIFQNMFESAGDKEIASPSIYRYLAFKGGGYGKSIIKLNTNFTFLSEFQVEKGRVLLFNSAPVLSWSNFPVKGIFAPLINKTVHYLASNPNSESEYIAGEEIFINISGRALPQLKIIYPDLTNEIVNIDSLKSKNYYRHSNTDKTGIYKFLSKNDLFDFALVNNDPAESFTGYLSMEEFEEFLTNIDFNGTHINIPIDADITEFLKQSRYGSELWKPILILALLTALLEMFISKSSKKDLVEITKDS
ncbi:BatA domain-containing protein [Bacteroidota bacterium]